jgi:hypothetical protein
MSRTADVARPARPKSGPRVRERIREAAYDQFHALEHKLVRASR